MEFTVEERLTMLNLLPAEGNLATMKIVHDLRLELAFSEEDLEVLKFEQTDNQLRWNSDNGLGSKEIKVGHQAFIVIHDELKKLDDTGKLRETHLAVADKFEYGE